MPPVRLLVTNSVRKFQWRLASRACRFRGVMSFEEVTVFATDLPNVTAGERWANRTWFVNGKGFVWERPFSKADVKRLGAEVPPAGPILAVAVADLDEKEAILAQNHKGLFTIEHFNGYAALLIQLNVANKRIVRELIIDAWLACAPRILADEYSTQVLSSKKKIS